jgi:hypothetical protein
LFDIGDRGSPNIGRLHPGGEFHVVTLVRFSRH